MLGSCAALVFAGPSSASIIEELEISPRFEARIAVTDNVNLTSDGETDAGQSDSVFAFVPGIAVSAKSRRFELGLDYQIEQIVFSSDGGTDARHRLSGLANAELVDKRLNARFRASLQETFLDRRQGLSPSFANRSENRQLVQNYTGELRWRSQFGRIADFSSSYRLGLTLSPADDLSNQNLSLNFSDTESHEYSAELNSGRRFGRLGWRLYGSGREVNRSLNSTNDFQQYRAGAEVSYRFNNAFRILTEAGWSDNSLQTSLLQQDGFSWRLGFDFRPSRRTQMTFRGGKDGDQTQYNITLNHAFTRRISTSFDYVDEVTSNSLVENGLLDGFTVGDNGQVLDQTGQPLSNRDPNFSLTDADFRRRTLNGRINWRGKKSSASLTSFWARRTFDDGSGTSKTLGLNSNIARQFGRKMDGNVSVRFVRNQFEGGNRTDKTIQASTELRKSFAENVSGAISYTRNERFSTSDDGDLSENVVSIYLRAVF